VPPSAKAGLRRVIVAGARGEQEIHDVQPEAEVASAGLLVDQAA